MITTTAGIAATYVSPARRAVEPRIAILAAIAASALLLDFVVPMRSWLSEIVIAWPITTALGALIASSWIPVLLYVVEWARWSRGPEQRMNALLVSALPIPMAAILFLGFTKQLQQVTLFPEWLGAFVIGMDCGFYLTLVLAMVAAGVVIAELVCDIVAFLHRMRTSFSDEVNLRIEAVIACMAPAEFGSIESQRHARIAIDRLQIALMPGLLIARGNYQDLSLALSIVRRIESLSADLRKPRCVPRLTKIFHRIQTLLALGEYDAIPTAIDAVARAVRPMGLPLSTGVRYADAQRWLRAARSIMHVICLVIRLIREI